MSLHRVLTAIGTEHNRRQAFAQAVVFALCLFALATPPASAGESGTAAVNLLPVKGQHRGIVLKSQTVDAIISEDQGKVWADTKVWLRLTNPASKPITVSVTLPGPQMTAVPLPSDLSVQVNKTPLRLLPLTGTEGEQAYEATASIGIPARRSVDVRLAFRQALPESDGVITYTYLLDGAAQWAGTPESLRVTVKMKPPIGMRSVLSIATPAHQADAQTLTWDWETGWNKSEVNVGLALMSPTWFAEFEKAQSAAIQKDAAAEHISLSQHYRRLASLPALLLNALPTFQSRYYPAAVAQLQAALDTKASQAEKSRAHSMLAELYVQQADHGGSADREQYLQAAAAEIELALGDSAPEPALVELAGTVFEELSHNAKARGDDASARGYLHRLEGVRASSPQQTAQIHSTDEELLQATHALAEGDTETARDLVGSLNGSVEVAPPGASEPVVSQTSLTVTTTPEGRQIVVHLGRGENLAKASELAERIADSQRSQARGTVIATANTVTITLQEPPGRTMFELQESLAAALPPEPELALLHSILADADGSAETQNRLLISTWRYTETVDLTPALDQWREIAAGLNSESAASLQEAPAAQNAQLQRIQAALNDSDAAAWRRFADSSTVNYRFDYSAADANREWQMRAGESRQLSVQQSRWNLEGIRWAAAALCTAVVGLAVLAWRLD